MSPKAARWQRNLHETHSSRDMWQYEELKRDSMASEQPDGHRKFASTRRTRQSKIDTERSESHQQSITFDKTSSQQMEGLARSEDNASRAHN